MTREPIPVQVECYAGYRGEETPRRISKHGRRVEITAVMDRWLAPDHRYFKVAGADGGIYILRQDLETGGWELSVFQDSRHQGGSGARRH